MGYVPGLIPSIGETSVLAILIGAVILRIPDRKLEDNAASGLVGGALMAAIFNMIILQLQCVYLRSITCSRWFCLKAVFMLPTRDIVRTETGKYIYGLVGAMANIIGPY